MRVKVFGFRPNRALEKMLADIQSDYASHHEIILIVPEHYTLEAQKDILNKLNISGFFNIQILTPSYLSSLMIEKNISKFNNVVSTPGEAVVLSLIVEKLSNSLAYYKDCFRQRGVYLDLVDFLSDLMRNEVSIKNIEEYLSALPASQLKTKWTDILNIYREYLAFFEQRFVNSAGLPKFTAESILEHHFFENKVVYVYGFDQIRKSLRDILVPIAIKSEKVLLYLNLQGRFALDYNLYIPMEKSVNALFDQLLLHTVPCELEYITNTLHSPAPFVHIDRTLYCKPSKETAQEYTEKQDNIIVFNGNSPYEEIKYVCAKVKELLMEGISFHKLAILLPEKNDYAFMLYSELLNLGIPFHNNEEFTLASHPLARYLMQTVYYLSNPQHPDYISALLHNPYCPLTQEETSFLNNYVLQNGITPNMWLKPFTRQKKQVQRAELLRQKLIEPILILKNNLLSATTFDKITQSLLLFLQENQLFTRIQLEEKILIKYGLYSSADYNKQLSESILDVLKQIQTILSNEVIDLHKLARYLDYGFQEASITALPPIDDSLAISTLTRVLLNNLDYLFILGFNENVLASNASGLFEHHEISEFEHNANIRLNISPEDLDQTNRQHIKKAFTMAKKKLYISYSKTSFSGKNLWPFPALTEMENRFFKNTLQYDTLVPISRNEHVNKLKREFQQVFIQLASSKTLNENNLLKKLSSLIHSMRVEGLNDIEIKSLVSSKSMEHIRPDTAKRLFKSTTVSVSRLEQYAKCPFKHFIDYGLKPDKNEKWETKASDTGTFYHAVFEQFFEALMKQDPPFDLSDQDVNSMLDQIIDKSALLQNDGPYSDNSVGLVKLKNMRANIKQAGQILFAYNKQSKFRIKATEYRFDEHSKIPFIISLEDGSAITLRGSIDRLDEYQDEQSHFMRVIDYKSSHKELKASELWYGSQLQLLLYLNVIMQHFKGIKPSGAFYFHINNPWVQSNDDNRAGVFNEQLKELRLDGVVLKDYESILALDINKENPISIAKYIKKDNNFSDKDKLLAEEDLLALIKHCLDKAKELASLINQGIIQVKPLKADDRLPCEFCEYKGICFVDKEHTELEKINFPTLIERIHERSTSDKPV